MTVLDTLFHRTNRFCKETSLPVNTGGTIFALPAVHLSESACNVLTIEDNTDEFFPISSLKCRRRGSCRAEDPDELESRIRNGRTKTLLRRSAAKKRCKLPEIVPG